MLGAMFGLLLVLLVIYVVYQYKQTGGGGALASPDSPHAYITSPMMCQLAGGTAYGFCPESGVHYCQGVCTKQAGCVSDGSLSNYACQAPTAKPANQILSPQDCLDAGGTNYNYCPESGVHYCDGVCNGVAGCVSNGNLHAGACQAPTVKPANQITSAQDCLSAGGTNYNFCPESGVHYCDGVCNGFAGCVSNGNLHAGACQAPTVKPTNQITSAQDCLSAGGTNYNFCPESGVHYCNGVCGGFASCVNNGNLHDGACQAPTVKPANQIQSAQDCMDAGGRDYNFCPESGIHYCNGVCGGIASCSSNGNLHDGAC